MMHGLLEIFEQIKLARSSQRQGGFDFLFKLPVPLPESHQVHGRFETRRPRSGRAEDMFDAASRYLLCPLKRAVADVLLPQLDSATPSELCCWLILSDMYGVVKIREYCLDMRLRIAWNSVQCFLSC